MAEDGRSNRARDKADRIDRKGLKRADPWIGMREEQLCKDKTRDGRIEEEVVPLDRRADGGGDHGAAKLHLVFGRGEGDRIGIGCCHWGSPWSSPKPTDFLDFFLDCPENVRPGRPVPVDVRRYETNRRLPEL